MFVQVGQREGVTQTPHYPLVRADAIPSAVNGFGGCGCGAIRSVGSVNPDGLGTNPDGLGTGPDGLGDCPPLFRSVTGSAITDAVLGGALGFLLAPVRDMQERMLWTAGGAAATSAAGIFGLIASVGVAVYVRRPRST
jgi:hypothetical protein